MMSNTGGPQRQRHGVKKKLVEGAGGLLTGAALVLLVREILKGRKRASPPKPQADQVPQPSSGETA